MALVAPPAGPEQGIAPRLDPPRSESGTGNAAAAPVSPSRVGPESLAAVAEPVAAPQPVPADAPRPADAPGTRDSTDARAAPDDRRADPAQAVEPSGAEVSAPSAPRGMPVAPPGPRDPGTPEAPRAGAAVVPRSPKPPDGHAAPLRESGAWRAAAAGADGELAARPP
ncbi:MAG: hypothetical protein D6738_02665, partial [Acidobacteria bacterium]